jgi:hypothetical protein
MHNHFTSLSMNLFDGKLKSFVIIESLVESIDHDMFDSKPEDLSEEYVFMLKVVEGNFFSARGSNKENVKKKKFQFCFSTWTSGFSVDCGKKIS